MSATPESSMHAARRLPRDCALLPLAAGELLVSRSLATYCRVPPQHQGAIRECINGAMAVDSLDANLLVALDQHGFFGAPRTSPPEDRSVQLQLTNACNLGCSYCCTNSGQPRARELPAERWFALVDELPRALGPQARVAILGGEPFLVPWAIDLAQHVVSCGLNLTVFTNGTLLGESTLAPRVAALIRAGAQVRVSLGGPTRAACDSISAATRFDQAIAGLHAVAMHGGLPLVDLMLLPEHVGEIAQHLHELRGLLPPGTVIAFGVLFHGGREKGERVFGSRADLEAALDRIAFDAGELILAPAPSPTTKRREGCTCALGHHLHVRSDGALFTCFKMEERVGSLDGELFSHAVARVRSTPHPVTTLVRCTDCPLASLCGGGCRSENLQFTGSAEEPVCGPWRVQILCELLAEDHPSALEWPAPHLLHEALARGIDAPPELVAVIPSRHLVDV